MFLHPFYWLFHIFFLNRPDFLPPCTLPMHQKNVFTKKPLNYYSLNVTEFHGDGVKNESARPKNREKGWGGDAERPPQRAACLGLNTFNTTN